MKKFGPIMTCGIFALLLVLPVFHWVENWRGRRAWMAWKKDCSVTEARLGLRPIETPPQTRAGGFEKAPRIIAALLSAGTPPGFEGLGFPVTPIGQNRWREGVPDDLKVWARALRAASVEDWLFSRNTTLDGVGAACGDPSFRLPTDGATWHVHRSRGLRGIVQSLRLRALVRLDAKDSTNGVRDILASLYLADTLKDEPTFVAQLSRIEILESTLQPIWEGIDSHAWDESQLKALQEGLEGIDLLTAWRSAWQGERESGNHRLAVLLESSQWQRASILSLSGISIDRLSRKQKLVHFLFYPKGWIYQNMVEFDRRAVVGGLEAVDPANHRIHYDGHDVLTHGYSSDKSLPYVELALKLLPAVSGQVNRIAVVQTSIDQAIIACALHRYRYQHKYYPVDLTELSPGFLASGPTDLRNGGPLKYNRIRDDAFSLYATGWDGVDQLGELALDGRSPPALDPLAGDWPWPTRRR